MNNKIKVKCENCSKEKLVYKSTYNAVKSKRFFCNVKCKADWQVGKSPSEETIAKMRIANSGSNNSNYKDGHTYEKSYCKCGNKKDWRAETCNDCYTPQSMLGKRHKQSSIDLISKASKEKFTDEYKINYRKKMEENGYWIPENELDDYKFYYKLCEWPQRMFDLDIEGKELLLENGVFNHKNNKKGVVRDHKLSRRDGLKLGIHQEIMRHPCNCELISSPDNISKGSSSSITHEELFNLIINYKNDWFEQTECIFKISEYNKGNIYKRT